MIRREFRNKLTAAGGLRGTALTVKTGDSRAADRTQMGARVRAA